MTAELVELWEAEGTCRHRTCKSTVLETFGVCPQSHFGSLHGDFSSQYSISVISSSSLLGTCSMPAQWLLACCYLLLVSASGAESAPMCFEHAIPAQNRKSLQGASGPYPIGVWVCDWPAAYMTSAMVRILLEEILGFHVVETGPGPSTVDPRREWYSFVTFQTATCFYFSGPKSAHLIVLTTWSFGF